MKKRFYTYIVTNKKRGVFYTGMTNNLVERVYQHKQKLHNGFTSRYNLDTLVWFDEFKTAQEAIDREKQIKGWSRKKKIALIESMNPKWMDFYEQLW